MKTSIKTLRNQLGLTQEQLAHALGVTTSTASKWERDEVNAPKWLYDYLQLKAESQTTFSLAASFDPAIQDTLHKRILEKLNGHIDLRDFEPFVKKVLEQLGLEVVPLNVHTGFAADPANINPDAEWSALVATTITDIRQNFERVMNKFKSVVQSRRIYLATTKTVSPKTKKKIYSFAEANGLNMANILDQNWSAEQLYRDPVPRQALLQLPEQPAALCSFPPANRVFQDDLLVGRERAVRRLLELDGDCVLSGAPGSGKTALLGHLVQHHRALFLWRNDREEIREGLWELNPKIVLVDDAYLNVEHVMNLLEVRREIDTNFRIIATCWSCTRHEEKLRKVLPIDDLSIVRLDPLTAREINDIVVAQGVKYRHLQSLISAQAHGMPGLAVSLTGLFLRHLNSVVSGSTRWASVIPKIVTCLNKDVFPYLAAIAVGGASGMPLKVIAEHFDQDKTYVETLLSELIVRGIVFTSQDGHVAIRPYPLALALVAAVNRQRSEWFTQYRKLFERAPAKRDAAVVLVGLLSSEKNIRYRTEIETVVAHHVEQLTNSDLILIASLGMHEANYLIERFPERLLSTARGFLRVDPATFLPKVFAHVTEPKQDYLSAFSQLQDLLEAWLAEAAPEYSEAILRRTALIQSAIDWFKQKVGPTKNEARVVNFVLTKAFENLWEDNSCLGINLERRYESWVPNLTQMEQLTQLWCEAVDCLCTSANVASYWMDTIDLIRQWGCALDRGFANDEPLIMARKQLARLIHTDLTKRFSAQPDLLEAIVEYDDTVQY